MNNKPKVFAPIHLNNWVEEFFNRNLADFVGNDFAISQPSVNILEHNDHFLLELAAPGLEKADFQINLEKDYLKVSASKSAEPSTEEAGKYARREFSFTHFERSFKLPENVDAQGIQATYDKGILSVRLPKTAQTIVSKTIEIG